jgi:hypothetical protein
MRSLLIEATEDSPEIKFDFTSKQFVISGKSRPENSGKFFTPVLNWFGEFEKNISSEQNNNTPLDFTFKLEYFNSISAKYIADIIMILKDFADRGVPIKINWHYPKSDEDMLEVGKEFSDMVELNFDFVAY